MKQFLLLLTFVFQFLFHLEAKDEKPFKLSDFSFQDSNYLLFSQDSNRFQDDQQYQLKSWMQDLSFLLNSKQLHEINIPGSHDSGAYNFSRKTPVADLPKWFGDLRKLVKHLPGDGIVAKWSKTQSLSIEEQLNSGVRYFDLRICQEKEDYYLYHGLRGPKLEDELNIIRTFLNTNRGEIVILDFSHFYNVNVSNLITLINKYLKDVCVKSSETFLPYEQLVASNKRCFIFCDNATFNTQNVFSLGKSNSKWVDKVDINELESALVEHHSTQNHSFIWILQYVLTPNPKFIAKHLNSSLKQITQSTHNNLSKFIKKFPKLNVVMLDFVNESSCKIIINQNLK